MTIHTLVATLGSLYVIRGWMRFYTHIRGHLRYYICVMGGTAHVLEDTCGIQ